MGWFAVAALPPAELEGYLVNVSGYPGDRGMGTEQYHHKNRVLRVTERRVFYDVDTFGGQRRPGLDPRERTGRPRSPSASTPTARAALPRGLEANSAPRIIPEVLERIRGWVEADGGWPKRPSPARATASRRRHR